jgi:cytochrome P450
MDSYLQRYDQTPETERWPLVRSWISEEPLPFYQELLAHRPVLVMPEVVLAARFSDCEEILLRYDLFSVVPIYGPKQGTYFMAQDDTAIHWREKSIMKSILDFEELPSLRQYVGQKTAALLAAANGRLDAVDGLTRAVPVALVQDRFGYTHSDPKDLQRWSYWSQMNAFWNQPFSGAADPERIEQENHRSSLEMGAYLVELVARRVLELEARERWDESTVGRVTGLLSTAVRDARDLIRHTKPAEPSTDGRDPVSRLLMLHFSKALLFDMERTILNAGGLLIGAVETTSHAVVNALDFLFQNPDLLAKARAAAVAGDLATGDGYVFEALRFKPAFPFFARACAKDTVLARGTEFETPVSSGRTVLALTASAMFDDTAFGHPEQFDPSRDLRSMFHFGLGLHECLGRAIAAVMIPEIVRQVLLLPDLEVGAVDYKGGPVPESWQWSWAPKGALLNPEA